MFKKELEKIVNYSTHLFQAKIKADANENLLDYPSNLRQILRKTVEEVFEKMRYYPQIDSENLRKSLADFYKLEKENFIVSNGSDELIRLIIQATCYPGDNILSTYPSFAMYRISANTFGVNHVPFPITDKWDLDVEKLIFVAKAMSNLKVIFIDTPNNPLGIAYSVEKLECLIKNLQDVLVVIDNAYGEYCDVDYFPLLKYPNVVLLKTFSKLGFAGLRCGYAISSKVNIEFLSKIKPPYNVNIFAQEICIKVLENFDLLRENISLITKERESMIQKLKPYYFVPPSKANFVSIIDSNCQYLYEKLKANEILVKLFSFDDFKLLRITLGKPEDNRTILDLLLASKGGDRNATS
ncbi:pyridoxal phosphate-dependent aminotransferase [Pseudothermotoga thermarum]|uniref:Histidinol phosphate aminotransferase apoenzyme n=1 Tax=Pseudothermotoga thermarum DSM 5069 TaxID=688269 RepID=F7YYR7_9THEM|nr:aminotransferase class I/II-fold pyridoxal phosphate-dependent enzyme [Pseudothermotoga thermarum]AEH51105.1 histidinol phosphate aminotransferase apoenzyme [Pseudothermotoga thermarum DSM 5069]